MRFAVPQNCAISYCACMVSRLAHLVLALWNVLHQAIATFQIAVSREMTKIDRIGRMNERNIKSTE